MKNSVRTIIIIAGVIGFLSGSMVHAETADETRIKQLQLQYDALEREAAQKRAVIATTREQADSLKKEITIIQNQIGAVQAQIGSTAASIEKTRLTIDGVQNQISLKRAEMSRKRDTVGRMIAFLDQRDREQLIASLFKYADLSSFVQQFHDLAIVQKKLFSIINEIKVAKASLEDDKQVLEDQEAELEHLNDIALQRKQQLAGVKGERDRVLSITKGQEVQYQKQLATIEKQKSQLFKELRELELKVVSGGLYIVHIKADNVPPRGTKIFQKPEDDAYVTQGYGMTAYARRGAYGGAPHNGVDASAGYGSPIKAIGDGKIVANGTNSGWGNWIAIQHPNNMVSVYGHMSSLAPLKVGTAVAVGQTIGYEGSTGNSTGSHLHLSLYKEFFTYLREKDNQLYFNYFEGTVNPADYL